MTPILERADRLASIADALESHAKNAVKLTVEMAEVGIFTNALEASFIGAEVAGEVVGNMLDSLLLSRADRPIDSVTDAMDGL